MNREPKRWSRRSWWRAVLFVLVLHLLFVVGLSERAPVRRPAPPPGSILRMVAGTPEDSALARDWSLRDPTLFALANPNGFCGVAWDLYPRLSYAPAEPGVRTAWFETAPVEWGKELQALVDSIDTPAFTVVRNVRSAMALPLVERGLGRKSSILRVEGAVAGRFVGLSGELETIPHDDVLTNSVVRVIVSPMGHVLSTVLVAGSGSAAADGKALELSRSVRFEPSAAPASPVGAAWNELEFGNLVFEWLSIVRPGTNAVGGASGPVP